MTGPVIGADALGDFVARLFVARGMGADDAADVARVLLWADLRGGDTHGVSRVPHYFGMIDRGALRPGARPQARVDFGGLIAFDAQGAAGPVAMTVALEAARARARAQGIALALVGGATHAGAMGCYAEAAARDGFAAIVMAAGPPLMAYEGSRIASVSTAPLAVAVPGGPDGAMLLDMASSLISNGRLKSAKRDGTALPPGAALDAEGRVTEDPSRAATLLPMGGPKGAGLALMAECVTSLLAGAPILAPMLGAGKGHGQSAAIILIDVARLREPAQYGADVDALVAAIKALPRAPEVDDIRLPGERGAALARRRTVEGVPVASRVWAELLALAERHGVAPPPLKS